MNAYIKEGDGGTAVDAIHRGPLQRNALPCSASKSNEHTVVSQPPLLQQQDKSITHAAFR